MTEFTTVQHVLEATAKVAARHDEAEQFHAAAAAAAIDSPPLLTEVDGHGPEPMTD
jgi:hypothetical protein